MSSRELKRLGVPRSGRGEKCWPALTAQSARHDLPVAIQLTISDSEHSFPSTG